MGVVTVAMMVVAVVGWNEEERVNGRGLGEKRYHGAEEMVGSRVRVLGGEREGERNLSVDTEMKMEIDWSWGMWSLIFLLSVFCVEKRV